MQLKIDEWFLVGNGLNSKEIRCMSWEKLCVVEEGGGLGLRNLRNFKVAMLAKQG